MGTDTIVLQSAATTGNGTVMDGTKYDGIVFYLRGNGAISAGKVLIEEDISGGAGLWSPVVPEVTLAVATDNVQASHADSKVYGLIRARISTTVTGGTVTATAIGRRSR